MKFEIERSIDDYIRIGNETTEETMASSSSLIAAIREYDSFFRAELWAGDVDMSANQAFLSMNAYMIYLGAIRMVMTGHIASAYPLFRTSLESACYALVIGRDPTLDGLWSNRHQNDESFRKARKRFSSTVSEAAQAIEESQPTDGHAKWIMDCYQSAIDFGAHPNPKSIYNHLRAPEDREDAYIIKLTGLHHADSFEMSRGLMACLDYGLVIAVVLSHSLRAPTQRLSEALFRLNELKERVTAEHFPDAILQGGTTGAV